MEPIIHRDRRLNIAPAVKKQASRTNNLMVYNPLNIILFFIWTDLFVVQSCMLFSYSQHSLLIFSKQQPVGRQDIAFSTPVDALSPPPPYDGTSVYFPQTAQATQFYPQPTPIPEPFFAQTTAFCPGPLPSTSLPSFYSSTTGPSPSGPVCYMPQQFQQFPQVSLA